MKLLVSDNISEKGVEILKKAGLGRRKDRHVS
jgi:hypothetical protein